MSNRLYVGNLSFNTSEDSLRAAFGQFGDVTEVRIVTDRETGRSRGFAFVSMADSRGAGQASSKMNGAMLDGRDLRVNEAEERQSGGGHRSHDGASRGAGGGRGFGGGRGRSF